MSKADQLRIADYLRHILEAIERIDEYVGDMTELVFLEDRRTQDAVIRNFEVMGEACRNLVKHHAYFSINSEFIQRSSAPPDSNMLPKFRVQVSDEGKLRKQD